MTRKAVMSLLLLGAIAPAQEVRMHLYYDGSEENSAILMTQDVRFLWTTQGLFFVEDLLMRTADHSGRFTSSETSALDARASGTKFDAAILPSGSFLVMSGGYVRVFDPTGTPLGPEFLATGPLGGGDPHVAALGDRFVVSWGDFRGPGPTRLWGRIVMEDGSMPYPAKELPENTSFHAYSQDLAGLQSGNLVVAWTRSPVGQNLFQPYMRIFDPALSPVSGDIDVDPGSTYSYEPMIASVLSGFVVTWAEVEPTGPNSDVVARLFDSAGNPVSAKFQVPASTAGDQANVYCAADPSGRFVVSWQDNRAGSFEVMAQRFSAGGTKIGPEFLVNGTTRDGQGPNGDPAMRADGSFIIPWSSWQDPDGSPGSFFRRYYFPRSLLLAPGPDPANPPLVQVVQPDGRGGLAPITPYGAGGFGANAGTGDIDGDGFSEILTGPGPSPVYGPHVRAFRASGSVIAKVNYYAYGTLRYGVNAAGGEIDGDGFSEILTSPGAGAVFGPHIRGWEYDGTKLRANGGISFFSQGTLRYGARVSRGDIDGDGYREILTAPGPGPSFAALVRGWNYDGASLTSIARVNFWAFGGGSRYGASVSAADMESDGLGTYGDGYQEILVGIGPDPSRTDGAEIYDYDAVKVGIKGRITPYQGYYGTNVAGGDIDQGDIEELVTAPGSDPSAPAHLIAWEWEPGIGYGYEGPSKLGPDDFLWRSFTRGASLAIGRFP